MCKPTEARQYSFYLQRLDNIVCMPAEANIIHEVKSLVVEV